MNIILLLVLFAQERSVINNFLNNTAPHLSYLVGGTEIIPDSKLINFGIEGNYSDYQLTYYNYIVRVPTINCFVAFRKRDLTPYLKLGLYPKTSKTNKSAPLLSFGCNLRPKLLQFLILRFGYGTLSVIEYFPGDPYNNYYFTNFHNLNFSLIAFKKIQMFTPFFTFGLLPNYVSGKYRNDAKAIEEGFSKLILGWHLGLGFKLFFVKFNGELVNNRLSASTSLNL